MWNISSILLSKAVGFIFLVTHLLATPCVHSQTQSASSLTVANQLFGQKKYAEAEQAFRTIIAQQVDAPTKAKATFNLGLTLKNVGRYDEAIATFKQMFDQPISDTEPGSHLMEPYRNYRPRAQWEIGNCYRGKRDYANALTAYRTTKEKYPFQSWCGNERAEYDYRYAFYEGLCLEHLGKTKEAIQRYYCAAFESRYFYSEPAVHFRLIELYVTAGQEKSLIKLLDEIDATLLSEARKQAEKENVKIDEEEILKFRPTMMMRRIFELKSFATSGQFEKLVALLKSHGSTLGPPDYWSDWEAIEAARLLALTPKESVAAMLEIVRQPRPLDHLWLEYALGCCGGAEAVAWLKERAEKEENIWAARALVCAISQAGPLGRTTLNSMSERAQGNLKFAIDQYKKGELGDKPRADYVFPKVDPATQLPTDIVNFRGR